MTSRSKMTVEEHIQTARDFLEASDHEFSNGVPVAGFGEIVGRCRPRADGGDATTGNGKPLSRS